MTELGWRGIATAVLAAVAWITASPVISAETAPGDVADRIEPAEVARVVADARRHNELLDQVARAEAEEASSPGDIEKLRHQLGLYRALIGYEQTTETGARILVNASTRLARFEAMAAPLDPETLAMVADLKVILYTAQRAYPLAAAWLPLAAGSAHARVIGQALAKLGQERFDAIGLTRSGRYVIRGYRPQGRAPDPGLLWPELHLVVTPAKSGRVHDTLTFSLVGQGAAGARRYYLAVNRLVGTRVIAFYGAVAPDYGAVRETVVDVLAASNPADRKRDRETRQ